MDTYKREFCVRCGLGVYALWEESPEEKCSCELPCKTCVHFCNLTTWYCMARREYLHLCNNSKYFDCGSYKVGERKIY